VNRELKARKSEVDSLQQDEQRLGKLIETPAWCLPVSMVRNLKSLIDPRTKFTIIKKPMRIISHRLF